MSAAPGERVLAGGLGFGEEPRWRDGALWFIDTWTRSLHAVDEAGQAVARIALDFTPGGIGWLPDGALVVVDVTASRVAAIDAPGHPPRTYVELDRLASVRPNGLTAAPDGTLFVASVGSELEAAGPRESGNLIRIAPDGRADVVWGTDLLFPNGLALTPDGRSLIVAETFGARVSVFDLEAGFARTVVAAPGTYPDGVCAAGDDAFWFADAARGQCLRGEIGGRVVERLTFSRRCYAPALHPDGRRLYAAIAESHLTQSCARMTAAIVQRDVADAEPVAGGD